MAQWTPSNQMVRKTVWEKREWWLNKGCFKYEKAKKQKETPYSTYPRVEDTLANVHAIKDVMHPLTASLTYISTIFLSNSK